jgi:hypothetical protein
MQGGRIINFDDFRPIGYDAKFFKQVNEPARFNNLAVIEKRGLRFIVVSHAEASAGFVKTPISGVPRSIMPRTRKA